MNGLMMDIWIILVVYVLLRGISDKEVSLFLSVKLLNILMTLSILGFYYNNSHYTYY